MGTSLSTEFAYLNEVQLDLSDFKLPFVRNKD